jgi:hypothetical protein
MAYTDHCDLYASVDEAGINLIAYHIMRQRPSLFNYATALIALLPWLACKKIDASPDIATYDNPLFTVEGPLPIFGADSPAVSLNYCAQLTTALVDFYPGNTVDLPAEMNPPLAKQHFAVQAQICAGLDCAAQQVNEIPPDPPGKEPIRGPAPEQQPIIPTGRTLDCFCLDVYAIGAAQIEELFGNPTLVVTVDAVDVPELAPPGMKDAVDCYLLDTARLVLREKLNFPLVQTFFFNLTFLSLPNITVAPAPNPPIPNNPAIENNELKVFIDFKVGP